MLMDAVEDVIFSAGRQQINSYLENNPDGTFTNEMFDLSKLTLEAIALIPKKERGAWAPGKEDLDAFCEDYKAGYGPRYWIRCQEGWHSLQQLFQRSYQD